MALETNAYKQSDAATDNVIPELYDETLQQHQYEIEVLRNFGTDVTARIMPRAGNSLNIYKGTEFSVSALTEGTITPVSALDFDNVELTVAEYGDAKQLSWLSIEDSFEFVVNDLTYGATGAIAENNDAVIMTELNTTTTTAVYPIKTGATRYVTGDIVATATFDAEMISEAKRQFQISKRVIKTVVIHPNQEKAVIDQDKFISEDNYAAGVLMNGALGKIYGAQIVPHTSVTSAVENTSVTVYRAIALAESRDGRQKSFVYGYKRMPTMKFDNEIDRNRATTFHYHYRFGAKIVWNEGIIVLKSA